MQVITPLGRFEQLEKTLENTEQENTEQENTYNLLAQFENDFEQLIDNRKEQN